MLHWQYHRVMDGFFGMEKLEPMFPVPERERDSVFIKCLFVRYMVDNFYSFVHIAMLSSICDLAVDKLNAFAV